MAATTAVVSPKPTDHFKAWQDYLNALKPYLTQINIGFGKGIAMMMGEMASNMLNAISKDHALTAIGTYGDFDLASVYDVSNKHVCFCSKGIS